VREGERWRARNNTMNYPEHKGFDRYSDAFVLHFDSIESVLIDWT
jgi:hypothetical protein